MKKKLCVFAYIFCMMLCCAAVTSCAAEVLWDEIPRDFGLRQETEGEASGDNDVRVVSLEEVLAVPERGGNNSFLMEEVFPYAYERLSEAEQAWYEDMEELFGSFGEKTELSEAFLDSFAPSEVDDVLDKVFRSVLGDHPEIFYVDGYSCTKYMRGEEILSIEFSGSYTMDQEAASVYKEAIEESAEAILIGIGEESSDYEKVKYVYDTLICSTDYDLGAPDNQNIYSVFVNHRSVCQGYAKAVQYLLNRLGVESTLVLGTVYTGEGHAWNVVKVDGDYYYVDATWGDVSYQVDEETEEAVGQEDEAGDKAEDKEEDRAEDREEDREQDREQENAADNSGHKAESMPEINYDYLNVTTEELLRTHSVGGVVPMPVCTATAANYYVMEGAYFTSYDREQMKRLFEKAAEKGRSDVNVKCSDVECYQKMCEALIEDQEIFDYIQAGEGGIAYVRNEKQLSLTFWVTNE